MRLQSHPQPPFRVFTEGGWPDHKGVESGTYDAWLGAESGPPNISQVGYADLVHWLAVVSGACQRSPDLYVRHRESGARLTVQHSR